MKSITTFKSFTMSWLYITGGIILLILVTGLIPSCTVLKTDYSGTQQKNAMVYYYLPESLLKIHVVTKVAVIYESEDSSLVGSPQTLEQSFSVTTENIADTRTLLSLNYKANAMMTDEIKYAVNKKGLLETVDIKTDDRASDIIAKLAEAPKTILGLATAARAAGTFVKIKEFSGDFIVKASELTAAGLSIPWIIPITNELKPADYVLADAGFTIIATPPFTNPLPAVNTLVTASTPNNVDAIMTRPLLNIDLTFQSSAGAPVPNPRPITVTIADMTRVSTVPVKRTAFAKRETKVMMSDGLVIGHDLKNPSSVEGFISIPINIAKAIVSVPGQLVTFKIDNTKRLTDLEKEKLNLEKSLQESQKYALTKETELDKLKLEIQKSALSSEYALQTLKYELEKTLLESEKKQLEALKALQEIKAELEKLKKPNGQ